MNNETLRRAYELMESRKKVLILESGTKLIFDELDFASGGNHSDHVNLYVNRTVRCVIDMRSVAGIMDIGYLYADKYKQNNCPKCGASLPLQNKCGISDCDNKVLL